MARATETYVNNLFFLNYYIKLSFIYVCFTIIYSVVCVVPAAAAFATGEAAASAAAARRGGRQTGGGGRQMWGG